MGKFSQIYLFNRETLDSVKMDKYNVGTKTVDSWYVARHMITMVFFCEHLLYLLMRGWFLFFVFPQFISPDNEHGGKHHPCTDYLQRSRCIGEEQGLKDEGRDDVGGAVHQVDGVRLLELVRADGQGLLEEGGHHEQEDLVAFQATGGETALSHDKHDGQAEMRNVNFLHT